ncbi:ABC-2 type transporter [Dillenia turbinata]|uniref:ABC-2 type transporter n=1 Tax=Dillenia turbinata TaxID=194707 RepID=A0AAN8WBS9_9MAGN
MESQGSQRVHLGEPTEVELNESSRRCENLQRDNDGPASEFTKKGVQNGGSGGEVDMQKIEYEESKRVLDKLIKLPEDNESLLLKLKHRFERVSIEQPTVEVRFENIIVDAEAYVGSRAIPTILNSCVNVIQDVLHGVHILPNKKETISILQDVSGILKPGRIFKHYIVLAFAGQLSYVFFRCVAVLSGSHVVSNITTGPLLIWLITFSGFALSKSTMVKWLRWAFWTSPLMFEHTALTINEFRGERWNRVRNFLFKQDNC